MMSAAEAPRHNVHFAGFKLTSERLAKAGICSAHDAQQITLWAAQFSKSEKQLGRFSAQEVTELFAEQSALMTRLPVPSISWEDSTANILGT